MDEQEIKNTEKPAEVTQAESVTEENTPNEAPEETGKKSKRKRKKAPDSLRLLFL